MKLMQCGATPGPGGYDHWHCQKRRWHDRRWPWQNKHWVWPGRAHRFNNYTWSSNGETHYDPVPVDVRWKA